MEETVRSLLAKLEGATDDARIALVQHNLPDILDAMIPGRTLDFPEKGKVALMDDFVTQGPAVLIHGALSNLTALKDQVCLALNDVRMRLRS
jgi:hypothetical protein